MLSGVGWQAHLIEDPAEARRLALAARRIAVLGIKPESHAEQPAHYVSRYMHDVGVEVIPVPVYYPEVRTILGRPVLRRVADVEGPIDLVVVFRRSEDVAPHLEDLLAAAPKGARARAGIDVVQDQCLMVQHRLARRL